MDERVYDEATKVEAEDGRVVLDGPDGVAVQMTPDAALETSDRLLDGATRAMGQQVEEARRRERIEPKAPPGPPADSDASGSITRTARKPEA